MSPATLPPPHADLAWLTKQALQALADRLLDPQPADIERCVQFVLAETRGHWHNRARAMMCRRLKHCALGRTHRTQLVACILGRFASGNFSEQFKDQLRLAMHLDLRRSLDAAREALAAGRPHVRRYAAWVLSVEHLGRAERP